MLKHILVLYFPYYIFDTGIIHQTYSYTTLNEVVESNYRHLLEVTSFVNLHECSQNSFGGIQF